MQAKVLVMLDSIEDGVRDSAYSDLEAGSVGNLGCYVGADGFFDLRRLAELHGKGRDVAADSRRNLRFVNHASSIEIGDCLVHLGDHHACGLDSCYGDVTADAVAAVAVLVGQRAVDESHVNGKLSFAEKCRYLAKETRSQRAVAFGHVPSLVGTEENAVDKERVLVLRLAERSRVFGNVEARDDLHVAQFICAARESLLKDHGNGGAALAADGVAAPDKFYSFVG